MFFCGKKFKDLCVTLLFCSSYALAVGSVAQKKPLAFTKKIENISGVLSPTTKIASPRLVYSDTSLTVVRGGAQLKAKSFESGSNNEKDSRAIYLAPLAEVDIGTIDSNWYEKILLSGDVGSNEDANIWSIIRAGFQMPKMKTRRYYSELRFFSKRLGFVQRVTGRAGQYLYHVANELKKRNMPMELALLPFVESAFNPNALSHARALGMWQFIPSTGRIYNLRQNAFFDERKDVVASTDAALNFLSALHKRFGDWQLALAAYNCGEGCVSRALKYNKRRKRSLNYSNLRLPRETRSYVPRLMAIKEIVLNPQKYSLELPRFENRPYFTKVKQASDIDLKLAIAFSGMDEKAFFMLNPKFHRPVVPAGSILLLPNDKVAVFKNNLENYQGQLSTWWATVVRKSRPLSYWARKWGVSKLELAKANRVRSWARIRAGSTVLVPKKSIFKVSSGADIPSAVIKNAKLKVYYKSYKKKKRYYKKKKHSYKKKRSYRKKKRSYRKKGKSKKRR